MKQQIREADLYIPVRSYLKEQGFDVKGEVGNCDVAAVRDGHVVIVEMKKRLNLEVILQAALRQQLTDDVYIAVSKKYSLMGTQRWKKICHLLRRLELGLLLVTIKGGSYRVEMVIAPESFDRMKSRNSKKKKREQLVREFSYRHGDYNMGGVTGRKIVTAYREKAIHIAAVLKEHQPLSISQLKERGTNKKSTAGILQKNYYGWFERVSRGVYRLSSYGRKELENFKELVEFYSDYIGEGE